MVNSNYLIFGLFLIIFITFFSCGKVLNPKTKLQVRNNIYAKKLLDNNFLQFADKNTINDLKNNLIDSFDIFSEENCKIVHIDAEELSEFNFDFFMPKLNFILGKRNIALEVKKTIDYENSLEIKINNEKLKLYTKSDMDNETFWDTAPRNFFKKVNEILNMEGINEQFYLLYSGNDLHALLLTKKQYQIITEYHINNEKEKPYKP
ncbi:hypothetical protein EDM00_08210 [Ornithobacterium rhinotracheale]|nr:hypothetical protein [Ornithobacterium rhinotracheale]